MAQPIDDEVTRIRPARRSHVENPGNELAQMVLDEALSVSLLEEAVAGIFAVSLDAMLYEVGKLDSGPAEPLREPPRQLRPTKKTATFRDLPSLVRHIVSGELIDPDAALELLYREYYYGSVSEAEYAAAIFNPALNDLTRLPSGVLDEKEELLPARHVPSSLESLRDLLERMISASRDPDLIKTVAFGWPGQGDGQSRFARHLYDLWGLREAHPPLYRALVSGRHRFVIRGLREHRYPGMTKVAAKAMYDPYTATCIRRVLECQALLWCAHDVQMILARNAKATSTPLGDLLSSDKTVVEPATVLGAAREWHGALASLLKAYSASDLGHVTGDTANTDITNDVVVSKLRWQVEQEAERRGIALERAARHVDALVSGMARRLKGANDSFLQAMAAPRASYRGPKSFHAYWFSGLAPLAASGVAVIRYLQAEGQVSSLIDELLPRKKFTARRGVALPAFSEGAMPQGWKERSRDLLHAWRGAVLNDKDLHSRSPFTGGRAKNVGKKPLDAAAAVLSRMGERQIGDDHGDQHNERRSFYLLDVLPEHRLACDEPDGS